MNEQKVFNLLRPAQLTEVVDIGANPIDGIPCYRTMLDNKLCRITGFEPQADALNKLVQNTTEHERYLPFAIGNGQQQTLHLCAASGMTSLLKPDQKSLDVFPHLKKCAAITHICPVNTYTLDEIVDIIHIDFLKIDIQGGELDVFQSAQNKLANTVAIQTEVSFITLYENQPTFGDVDLALRNMGFIPHHFAALKKWPIAPMVINQSLQPLNQLLEADIVYVRDFINNVEEMSHEQLKQLALIAHCCYQSYDLTLHCIELLEQRGVMTLGAQAAYLALLKPPQAF